MKASLLIFSLLTLALTSLAGCATHAIDAGKAPGLSQGVSWSVVPLVNNTETPYAGARAQQILVALLGSRDLGPVELPPEKQGDSVLPVDQGQEASKQGLEWAARHQVRYALRGSVDEWKYKTGLDGQPAVGFTLQLVDLNSHQVLWSGTASASGASHQGLAVLAQQTLKQLLERLLP